jgi:hypothetical protein
MQPPGNFSGSIPDGTGAIWEAIPVAVTYVGGYGAMALENHAVPATAPIR